MTNGDTPDDFTDVFSREGSDMGADTAAPVEQGQPRDEAGRFAPKGPEAAPEAAPPAPAVEAQPEATPPQTDTPSDRQPRHVPLPELLKERERYKSEATLRAEAEKRASDMQAQFEALQRQVQAMQQPRPEPEPEPDPYADPAGYARYQAAVFQQQLANERANMSEMLARQKYGDAAVQAAQQAAIAAGAGQHFMRQRDPYGALMQWHRQQSFLQKVGNDPDAYEKSIEQRAYEKALADLKAGKVTPPGSPQAVAPTQQRFPGSLAAATATGNGAAHLSDEAAFSDVFSNRRA